MPANETHLTSIIKSFSLYLDRLKLDSKIKEVALLAFLDFLKTKKNLNHWSNTEIDRFLAKNASRYSHLVQIRSVLDQFVNYYPPYQSTVFLNEFLLALSADNCSYATLKNYRSDIGQFITFAKETKLKKLITKPKVVSFLKYQAQKGLKPASIKRKLASISQFALWAKERGLIDDNLKWLETLKQQDLNLNKLDNQKATPKRVAFLGLASLLNNWPDNLSQIVAKKTSLVKPKNINRDVDPPGVEPGRPGLSGQSSKPAEPMSPVLLQTKPKISTLNHASALPTKVIANNTHKQPFTAQAHQDFRARLDARLSDINQRVRYTARKQVLPYLNLALIILFVLGLGVFGWRQFKTQTEKPLAYPTSLTRPTRSLSFQGRLTDTAQNPITGTATMRFKLYDANTGGNVLWDSGSCTVDPDQDGIFTVNLGDDCGSEITQDVFTENSNVWLEVETEGETLSPRQPIKTVAYALNAETLQGYPASASAVENTVLVMNNDGEVVFGNANPKLKATGQSFAIEAETMTLQTPTGSNGDISLSPDGTGRVNINSDLALDGFLEAPGATLSANYAGGTALVLAGAPSGTADIMQWKDNTGATLGVIDENGNVGIGTTSPSQKLHVEGGIRLGSTSNVNNVLDTAAQSGAASGSLYWGNSELLTSTNLSNFGVSSVDDDGNGTMTVSPTTGDVKIGINLANANTWTGLQTFNSLAIADTDVALTGGSTNLSAAGNFSINTDDLYVEQSSGNVGVGTTSPEALLHLYKDTNIEQFIIERPTVSSKWGIKLQGASTADFKITDMIASTEPFTIEKGATSNTLYLNSSGNVGIGTTSPGALLHLSSDVNSNTRLKIDIGAASGNTGIELTSSSIAGGSYWIKATGDDTTDSFVVKGDGNVGIGKSDAIYKLDVGGSGIVGRFAGRVIGADAVNSDEFVTKSQLDVVSANTLPSGTSGQTLRHDGTNWVANSLLYNDGTNIGIGTTSPSQKLQVVGSIQGDSFLDNSNPSYYLNPADINISLTTAGNVGVGTTSPLYNLEVQSAADAALFLEADTDNTTESDNAFLKLSQDGGAVTSILGTVGAAGYDPENNLYSSTLANATLLGTLNAYPLQLGTNGAVSLTIDTSGNVGIGTTSPETKLHVANGNILLDNSYYLKGDRGDGSLSSLIGIDGSQNIVIGESTSVPSSVKIMTPVDAGQGVGIYNGSTNIAWFENSGNVGIGTTSPSTALDVAGVLELSGVTPTDPGADVVRLGDAGTNLRIQTNYGYINIGPQNTSWGHIITDRNRFYFNKGLTVDTGLIGTYNEDLSLQTAGTTRITILNADGNVGIGTTSPGAKLDVAGSSILGSSATDTTTINGYLFRGLPIRFTRSTAAINATTATKDNTCISEFGNSYQTATIGDVAFNIKGGGSINAAAFTVINYADRKFYIATDYTNNGVTYLSSSYDTSSSVSVACVRKDAPLLISRTTAAYNASDATKDSACSTDYGDNYRAANHPEVAAYFSGAGPIAYSTIFNVAGNTSRSFYATYNSTYYTSYIVDTAGNTYGVACIMKDPAGGADYAETIPASVPDLQAGEILTTDPNQPKSVTRSTKPYQKAIVGVVPTQPGLVIGEEVKEGYSTTVALAGRVPLKVTTENGPIKIGDPVTSSSLPGVGMKATRPGYIVGTALTSFTSDNPGEIGEIIVFVNPGFSWAGAQITDQGLLNLTQPSWTTNNQGELTTTKLVKLAQAAAETIQTRLIEAKNLVVTESAQIANLNVDSLSIGGVSLKDYISNIVAERENAQVADQDQTAATSPTPTPNTHQIAQQLEGTDLDINLIQAQQGEVTQLKTDSIKTTSLEATGSTKLGQLVTQDATISGTLTANTVNTTSIRTQKLEAEKAKLNQVDATIANLKTATVSGTLYADEIDALDQKIAQAFETPDLVQVVKEKLGLEKSDNTWRNDIGLLGENALISASFSAELNKSLADLSLDEDASVITADAAFIDQYFKVNGTAYVADSLGIGGQLFVYNQKQTVQLGANYLAFNPTNEFNQDQDQLIFAIQPSGKGVLALVGNTLVVDGRGQVAINANLEVKGNVKVGGTLLANLIKPNDFDNPLQVQVAGIATESGKIKQSRFEIIDATGTPVATISAQGKAEFAGGVGIKSDNYNLEEVRAASSVGKLAISTDKTAGKAVLPAGRTKLVIESHLITETTLIYVTPLGSTNNQVLYVADQQSASSQDATPGQFSVNLDKPLDHDLEFNWWMVN